MNQLAQHLLDNIGTDGTLKLLKLFWAVTDACPNVMAPTTAREPDAPCLCKLSPPPPPTRHSSSQYRSSSGRSVRRKLCSVLA